MGDEISPNTIVLVMTVTFLLYSFVGGLIAAAWTDFVQSFFIIALSFLLIPLGLNVVGGFSGIRESLQPEMLSMVTPGDVGVFTIVMLTINGLIGIVAQPHILASVGTGHDENSCRWGMAAGNFVKRFCTIGWALVGLIVAAMLVQRGSASFADPEEAFGFATRELLFPGTVGLMIACVLAANMSTGSAFTVDGGALFTQNFYRRYLRRVGSDRHYLMVGRIAGVLVTTTGVLFGLYVESVLEAFLFTETIAAFMGISMFGAISWRRANRHGAFASLLVSSGVFFYFTYQDYLVAFAADPQTKVHPFLQWDAMNFGIALLAGFVSLAVVSLLTKPEAAPVLDEFYGRLHTASYLDRTSGEERNVQQPGHDLLFVNLFDLQLNKGWKHFYGRFRVDLIGLLLAFGVVAALIALAKGILYLP
jgi:Na+/proline symporter